MKTLFNNLLLNHRFVFQENNPGEQLQKAAEAAAQSSESADAELDALVGQRGSNQDFNDWFDRETSNTLTQGEEQVVTHSESIRRITNAISSGNKEQFNLAINEHNRLFVDKQGKNQPPVEIISFEDDDVTPRPEILAGLRGETPISEEQLAQAATEAREGAEQPGILLESRMAVNNLSNFKDIINAHLGKGVENITTADRILNGINNQIKQLVEQGNYEGLNRFNRQINSYTESIKTSAQRGDAGIARLDDVLKRLERRFA